MSTGAIIVRHLGRDGISNADVLAAVPETVRDGNRENVLIDQRATMASASESRDWSEARRLLAAEFDAKLGPVLAEHPDYDVHYFGTSSIPLMMLLGFKTSTVRRTIGYNHHHTRKNWTWDTPNGHPIAVDAVRDGVPNSPSRAQGDLVVRVSVSYLIDPDLTTRAVPESLADVDVRAACPSLDVITSPDGVDAVAERFRQTLDALLAAYPNAGTVHVFAAVPPGVAFRLGTVVSNTIHPRVQLYEFDRPKGGYYPAFVLQEIPRLGPTSPGEDRATLATERGAVQKEMTKHVILFLASHPNGLTTLELGAEAAAIQTELDRSRAGHRFELVTRWAVQPMDLLRELRRLRPTVVHFSGHGARPVTTVSGSGDAHRDLGVGAAAGGESQSGLYFHAANGFGALVSVRALAEALVASGSAVKLAVLSACYSDEQAQALLPCVGCVVGSRSALDDRDARHYAIGLYGGLGEGESVAAAHAQGCAAIVLERFDAHERPQLLVRVGVDAGNLYLSTRADPR